jgi:malate dehydrogenase (oxaloacetate-decarboxylating)
MSSFHIFRDNTGKITHIETTLSGNGLLKHSFLNKDTAFSPKEREQFNLEGKLPSKIESLEEQTTRAYQQFKNQSDDFSKFLFLDALHNHNETLFYKLTGDHVKEMLPIVYTPTIGEAVQKFSSEFREQRGIIISYDDKDRITDFFRDFNDDEIDMIVVTDGERVLGIGDQGVGGLQICVGKLAVYSICAGVNPSRVLPIQLDVGTNNETLLNDPLYLGSKHKRLNEKEYDEFIDAFVTAVYQKFPRCFLHWEDFGRDNARKNLARYRDKICTFNDDMQGTGAVTLASILSALTVTGELLKDQRIVFLGEGTAATGIADQIVDAMIREGDTQKNAESKIYLLGRHGLLTTYDEKIMDFQMPYAKSNWSQKNWPLIEVVKNIKPTILIGVSTATGAFTEEIVKEMATHTEHPIIFPLSNPTSKCEAHPKDLLEWTKGKALIATGSPFDDITYQNKEYRISQCNNAFIFPGLGLGLLAVKATRCTNGMIHAACKALTNFSPAKQNKEAPLLPDQSELQTIALTIAKAVAQKAIEENVAEKTDIDLAIQSIRWEPAYVIFQ